MSVAADIVDYLREYHTSENKAIKGRELCELFNLHSKQVRNIVSDLRQDGEPICSSNYGYWYSKELDDIDRTIKRLSEQVKNMSRAIEGLQKAKEVAQNEE
ncbi:hypothetical protein CE91St46_14480 [Eubacteriales bacterium]|nr:hypothetical protein CE91St46_14480 [Eubacteriales bacterium]GKH62974.1 hypothetical protein CE91St47_14430 [Eubacteriales bacterium]